MCCSVSLADADHFFVDFAILMNQFMHYNAYMDPLHFLDEAEIPITDTVTPDINYNMLISSYGRKKQDSFLKKEMFTSDTFLNVKQSCILVIRVVFKVQLKDLMTANTKNIFKN